MDPAAAIVEQSLLQVAQNMEEQLDAQIHQLDNLGEDDLERIRRKRLEEFRRHEKNKEQWLAKGHGAMSTVTEKDFFKEIKGGTFVVGCWLLVGQRHGQPSLQRLSLSLPTASLPFRLPLSVSLFPSPSFRLPPSLALRARSLVRYLLEERLVCLFYRASPPCEVMEKHLRVLAAAHLETKFMMIEAEKAPFLAERLKIWMLPTLAIVKNEKTTDYIVGLDDMGGVEDFDTGVLESRLIDAGVLFEQGKRGGGAGAGVGRGNIRKGGVDGRRQLQLGDSDEDSDF